MAPAPVVLHLEIEVAPEKRDAFLAFCRKAFPVYEKTGGCRMVLYEDRSNPNRFDEVGYYDSMEDYDRSERAIEEDLSPAEDGQQRGPYVKRLAGPALQVPERFGPLPQLGIGGQYLAEDAQPQIPADGSQRQP